MSRRWHWETSPSCWFLLTTICRQTGKYGPIHIRLLASFSAGCSEIVAKNDSGYSRTTRAHYSLWKQPDPIADAPLCRDCFKTGTISTVNPPSTAQQQQGFPLKWASISSLHGAFASRSHSLLGLLDFKCMQGEPLVVSVPLLWGSAPCGIETQVQRDPSLRSHAF